MTDKKQRYSIVEREALDVIEAVKVFDIFIFEHKTKVFLDQQSLILLLKQDGPPKVLRWSEEVMQYFLDFQYIKGCKNICADQIA